MQKSKHLMRLLMIGALAGAVAVPAAISSAATETYAQKHKIKKKKQQQHVVVQRRVRTNFHGTPAGEPPIAGMSDFCGYWYAVNNRLPAGCDENGRTSYLFDD